MRRNKMGEGRRRPKQIVITCTVEEKELINSMAEKRDVQVSDVGRELLLSWANEKEVKKPIRKGVKTTSKPIKGKHTEDTERPSKDTKKGIETISHSGRKSRTITLSTGEVITVSEYSERSGIPADVIRQRIKRGTAPDAEYRSR